MAIIVNKIELNPLFEVEGSDLPGKGYTLLEAYVKIIAKINEAVDIINDLEPNVTAANSLAVEVSDMLDSTKGLINNKRDKDVKLTGSDMATNSDAVKLKLINLADEVIQAITGNTPVNNVIGNDAVVTEKIANKSVTSYKTDFIEPLGNLYNKVSSVNGYITSTGQIIDNATLVVSEFIEVTPDTTYYLSTKHRICWFAADKTTVILYEDYPSVVYNIPVFVTVPAGAYYIRIMFNKSAHETQFFFKSDLPRKFEEFSLSIQKLKINDTNLSNQYQYDYDNSNIYDGSFNFNGTYKLIKAPQLNLDSSYISEVASDSFIKYKTKKAMRLKFDGYSYQSGLSQYLISGSSHTLNLTSILPGSKVTFGILVKLIQYGGVPITFGISEYDANGSWLGTNNINLGDGLNVSTITLKLNTYKVSLQLTSKITDSTQSIIDVCGWFVKPGEHTAQYYLHPNDIGSLTGFEDKTIAIVGDSITAQGKYQPFVQSILNPKQIINWGVNGSRLTNHSTGSGNDISLITRWTSFDITNVDVMTIFIGINDYSSSIPLGNIDTSINDQEFYGAYKTIIEGLLTSKPNLRLFLITPMVHYSENYNGTGSKIDGRIANGVGLKVIDYRNAVKNLGERYNLPCIDMFTLSGFNFKTLGYFTSDGLHPNDNGGKVIGKIISNFIKSI